MRKLYVKILLGCLGIFGGGVMGQATLPIYRTIWDVNPTGWTDAAGGSYLSIFACSGNNGGKFDNNAQVYIVNFNSAPDALTFVFKSNTAASTSTLIVEQSANGISYTSVVSLTGNIGIPSTCATKGPYTLNSTTRYVRWTFTKGTSNGTIDDVNITAPSCTPPTITTHPTDKTICIGSTIFTAATSAGSPTYQWQSSSNGSTGWADVVNNTPANTTYTNSTTASMTVNATTAISGYFYRCKITAAACDGFTNAAKLVVDQTPSITTNPANAILCGPGNTNFTVAATGTNLNYQWEASNSASGPWTNVANGTPIGSSYSGNTAATLNVTGLNTTYFYRSVVSNIGCGSVNSTAASGTVNPIPATPAGSITVSANPSCGPATLTYPGGYYWQTSNAGISTSSLTSAAYILNSTGIMYVRELSAGCWSPAIATATITINTQPAIITHPISPAAVCASYSGNISVTASGNNLIYQWQSSNTNAGPWTNVINGTPASATYTGITGSTLNISSLTGTYYYRCVVSNGGCIAVNSNVATITVNALPPTPAGNIMVSSNPSCGAATLTYPSGFYWQTTSGGILTTFPTSSSYILNASGTMYVRAFDGICWSTSLVSPAIVINTAPAISTQPANVVVSAPTAASFSVTTSGTVSSYQWQVNSGSGWSNLTNTSPYNNVNTATLNINPTTEPMSGYLYRCVVIAANPCGNLTSDAAILTVNPGPLWTNPITDANPSSANPYTNGDFYNLAISVSGISRGTGILPSSAANRYSASNWSTTTIDQNDYFEFTLTPNSGKTINFVNFVYTGQVSGGSSNHSFRSSVDGFTTDVGAPIASGTTINLSGSSYQNIFCPITFRFYSYGLSASTRTYSIDDFTFNGTTGNVGASALTISNSGTPAAGNIFLSTSNNIFSSFDLTANTSQTFSAVTIKHTGTATAADVSNVRIFWDQNANGIIDGVDAIVPGATVASLAASMTFSFATAQTFSCKRKYLVIGDVLGTATLGRTVITSVNTSSDITSTIPTSGNAIGNTQTISFVSFANDYFRSNVASGSWASALSWESSHDNSSFFTASIAPTKSATSIIIRNGHNINISTSGVSMTNTTVQTGGVLEITTNSSFEVAGSGSGRNIQLTIKNGADFLVNSPGAFASPTGTGSGMIETGGKVIAGPAINSGGGTPFVDAYIGYNNGLFYFQNNGICEWLSTNAVIGSSSPTDSDFFFPDNPSDLTLFRISASPFYPFGSNGTSNIFYAILEANALFRFQGTNNKTFTGGIQGNDIVTQIDGGSIIIGNGTNVPILGGAVTLNVKSDGLRMNNGALVPTGANVRINSLPEDSRINKTAGVLTINGTLDVTDMQVRNINSVSDSIIVNGTLKTSNKDGLIGTSVAAPGAPTITTPSRVLLNIGSTIEYNRNGDQALSSTVDYDSLTLSTGGTKTPNSSINVSGQLKISGAATVVDATSNNIGIVGANSTKLVMDDGLFILGTSETLPLMRGAYNITGGIIRYTYSGATTQRIRNPASGKYQNIVVTGTNVANSSNVPLNAGGSFTVANGGIYFMRDNSITGDNVSGQETVTVKSGGRFKTENGKGFHGFSATFTENSSIHSNVENIVLEPGSTVEYSRDIANSISGDQEISNAVTLNSPSAFVYQNLIISGTGNKTAPASTLSIAGNLNKSSTSIFKHNGGTVLFNGTGGQTFSNNSNFQMVFNNVTNNSIGLGLAINGDSMAIVRKLKLGTASNLLLNFGDIILKSSDTLTANVDSIPSSAEISYSANNRFITERYIKYTGNWNLISSPVAGNEIAQSIKQSWQEGALNKLSTGYGTQVTAPGPGPLHSSIDTISVSNSVKWWDPVANAFVGVNNTETSFANQPSGFYTFVRGDRSFGPNKTGEPTTLRSKGKLYIGNTGSLIEPPGVSHTFTSPFVFYSVANPFASAINFQRVYNNPATKNITPNFYLWDPTESGSYNVGRYQTFAGAVNWLPTPGRGLYYKNYSYDSIQSGQAFYVASNLANNLTAVNFSESAKVDSSRTVTRGGGIEALVMMSTMLHNGNGLVADGNRVVFDNAYSKEFAKEDARKITNSGENFGITINNYTAIVEGRPEVAEKDTIFYKMSNLQTNNYKLSFEPRNLSASGLEAFLIDNFLNSSTPISLSDSTYYNFAATAVAASKAANRFMLVFKAAGAPLPVTLTQILAKRNNDLSITVTWKVEQEQQLSHYEVERSADGVQFTKLATVTATNASEYTQLDAQPLSADNYYRIKAVSQSGAVQYSRIVKVAPLQLISTMTVYPNPVVKHDLQLQLSSVKASSYKLQLYNNSGQLVFEKTLQVAAGSQHLNIALPKYLSKGNYRLSLQEPGGVGLWENVLLQ